MVPSGDPAFLFSLRGGGVLGLHAANDGSRLGQITGLEEMAGFPGEDADVVNEAITPERRHQLLPAAKLLVTIPPSNDRVVLRRLDVEAVLPEIVGDDVLVTSPSTVVARPGARLTHHIRAVSSAARRVSRSHKLPKASRFPLKASSNGACRRPFGIKMSRPLSWRTCHRGPRPLTR